MSDEINRNEFSAEVAGKDTKRREDGRSPHAIPERVASRGVYGLHERETRFSGRWMFEIYVI